MMMLLQNEDLKVDCSCDPYSPTTDCCTDCCTPFFSFFLVLELLILIVIVGFFTIVECISKNKSNLWRAIFISGSIACLAKVIRLGLLANPDTRHSPRILLLFLLNTHQSFGVISFLSLVFFWARLHHDLVANKGIYGKLLPGYATVVILTLIVYYLQLPVEHMFNGKGTVVNLFKVLSAGIVFCSAIAYVIYGFLLWKRVLRKRSNNDLFFRVFVSALVTAIFLIIICLIIFITRFTSSNTVHDFLIRHTLYEFCYFTQLASMPSGFISHFVYTARAPDNNTLPHPPTPLPHTPLRFSTTASSSTTSLPSFSSSLPFASSLSTSYNTRDSHPMAGMSVELSSSHISPSLTLSTTFS